MAHKRQMGFDESTATIYAMIEVIDRGIRELILELDKLELSEKTLVIFASDNGPDPITGTRFNQNLRGTKYQIYEGGIQVPFLVYCPGPFKATHIEEVVHFVDVFPTILALCGIDDQASTPLDGDSFFPLLVGDKQTQQESVRRYWQWNRGVPNYTHHAAIREGNWKLVRPFVTRSINPEDSDKLPVLFDLAADPTEANDCAKDHAERVALMNALLNAWCESVEADRIREYEQQPIIHD